MKLNLSYNPSYKTTPTRPAIAAWELRTVQEDGTSELVSAYPVIREYSPEGWRELISTTVLKDLAYMQYAANAIEITREAVNNG